MLCIVYFSSGEFRRLAWASTNAPIPIIPNPLISRQAMQSADSETFSRYHAATLPIIFTIVI